MKKNTFILLMLICLFSLVACGGKKNDSTETKDISITELSSGNVDEMNFIKTKYLEYYPNHAADTFIIDNCFLTNDSIYFFIAYCPTKNIMQYHLEETISGFRFIYDYNINMEVLIDDNVYQLADALSQNLITLKHLEKVYDAYNTKNHSLYQSNVISIDVKLVEDIIDTYRKKENLSEDQKVTFSDYYKEYNGAYAFKIYKDGYYPQISYDIVDGVSFTYPSNIFASIYKDGVIYSVEAAFNAGLLSHDDLVDLASRV